MKSYKEYINESILLLAIANAMLGLSDEERTKVLTAIRDNPNITKDIKWKKNMKMSDFESIMNNKGK